MDRYRSILILACFLFMTFSSRDTARAAGASSETEKHSVLAQAMPEYNDIKHEIELGRRKIMNLIQESSGTLEIFYDVKFNREKGKAINKELQTISGSNHWAIGSSKDIADIRWYKKSGKYRHDLSVDRSDTASTGKKRLPPLHQRMVVFSDKTIRHDLTTSTGYIDEVDTRGGNLYPLIKDFDIEALHCYKNLNALDHMKVLDSISSPVITLDSSTGIQCLKLLWDFKVKRRHHKISIFIAPQMDSSLVGYHSQTYSGEAWKTMIKVMITYKPQCGSWFYDTIDFEDHTGDMASEWMKIQFRDVNLNTRIPDDTFTFKGLGLPPGSLIYDKRGEETKTYLYLSSMNQSIDKRDIPIIDDELLMVNDK